jgi:hypothetical protein
MALIHDIAVLSSQGTTRDDIAASIPIARHILDWLMDSDSFLVVLEQVGHGAADGKIGGHPEGMCREVATEASHEDSR